MDVKVGEYYATISHGKVVKTDDYYITTLNEKGEEIKVSRDVFQSEFVIAGKFKDTKKVSASEIENIIRSGIGSNVFVVKFTKKPDINDGIAEIDNSQWQSLDNKKKRKVVSSVLTGEERTMVARLDIDGYGSQDIHKSENLGRIKVIDMEKSTSKNHANRLVDLRTITELIVNDVKYVKK